MDRTGIIVVTLCAILLVFWAYEQNQVAEQQARYNATNQAAQAQSRFAATSSNALSPALNAIPPTELPVFDTNKPEVLLVVTNARARYTFTSRGGGLKSVELLDYPETVSARWIKKVANDGVATLNQRAPAPVLAILGDASLVGDGNFTLTQTADGVRAEKSFANGLRIAKEFQPSSNYLVKASVRLENASGQPLVLPAQEWIVGTATPMGPDDNGLNVGALWYNGTNSIDRGAMWFSGAGFGCFRGSPRTEYLAGSNNVVWVAAHNQFFALMAMPKEPAGQVIARPVNLPLDPNVEPVPGAPALKGVQSAFIYPAASLAAHQAVERQIVFFAGPKEYRLLARIGDQFQNQADLVMQFGKFSGFFAKGLLLAMNWLHDVTRAGLRLGDCVDHGDHQGVVLAADGGEHALDEADAGARAGDAGAQGKIQGRHAKAHPKAVGTLSQTQGQPDERLPAHGHSNARVLWLFHDDPERDRTARRAPGRERRNLGRGSLRCGQDSARARSRAARARGTLNAPQSSTD